MVLSPMFRQGFRTSVAAEADRIIYHTFPTKVGKEYLWILFDPKLNTP